MLPKWHILFGAIFSLIWSWLFPITIFQASLIFLSSILIDFDHYMLGVIRNKILNLKKLYFWHKNLSKNHKPIMHIFHSIEFILFIAILSYYIHFFLFILIGMLFHSILDMFDIIYNRKQTCREFSLIRYLFLKEKYPEKYF